MAMTAEPYAAQGSLYREIGEAVGIGFAESGLEKAMVAAGGSTLVMGLRAYVTILLAVFTHRSAMSEKYEDNRASFGKFVDDYSSNAVLRLIQHGDIALFQGGMFFSGIRRQREAAVAADAYYGVADLLRKKGKERAFFSFLSRRVPEVMEGMGVAAEHLSIPRQRSTPFYLPAIEKHLGRS